MHFCVCDPHGQAKALPSPVLPSPSGRMVRSGADVHNSLSDCIPDAKFFNNKRLFLRKPATWRKADTIELQMLTGETMLLVL